MKNQDIKNIEIPESLESFRSTYVSELTESLYRICLDIKTRREKALEGLKGTSKEYTEALGNFIQELRREGNISLYYTFVYGRIISKETLREYAVKQSYILVNNLIKRVEKKVGPIEDANNLYLTSDNQGSTILAGNIKGVGGYVTIKSIIAGGYNVQKLHVRVTVR